jgi:hypothetical protein
MSPEAFDFVQRYMDAAGANQTVHFESEAATCKWHLCWFLHLRNPVESERDSGRKSNGNPARR